VSVWCKVFHKQEQSIIKTRSFDLEKLLTLVVVMTAVERWKRFCRVCFGAEMTRRVRVAICGNRGKLGVLPDRDPLHT
jgi:hypothetical protein